MKQFLLSVSVVTLTLCAACTTRGAYDGVRQGQLNHCNEVPDTGREKCLAKAQDDYDTYRRNREEVKKNP